MSDDTRTGSALLDQILASIEESKGEEGGAQDFSGPVAYPYLVGLYLAVNAIEDAFLLVEGPDCAYMKTQYIQGNHDWLSTLTSVSGFHRVTTTALHPAMMTDSREGPLREMLVRIGSGEEVGGVVVTSMPMAFVTGADYERVCRDAARETGTEVVHVPGLSLSGDWLDGYQEILKALARQITLPKAESDPRKVAIVGYLFDRNEEDHRANVEELRRMCAALDLELVSVWLSGQRFEELGAVAEAGTILSLPYGRRAARELARRTGAALVKMPLPFGPTASESWMRTLGERFERADAAEQFIDAEMSRIVPRMEWLVPFLFQGKSYGYVGDPHLYPGVADILDTMGCRSKMGIVTNNATHLRELASLVKERELLFAPSMRALYEHILRTVADGGLDLLVSSSATTNIPFPDTATLEFGFPSFFRHALFERPFLGFRGFAAFVDDLSNTLRRHQLTRSQRRFSGE